MREGECTWKDETRNYVAEKAADDKLTKELNAPNVTQIIETAALHNLKEAFQCWLASTTMDLKATEPEALWKEFELFANEILTPVDAAKQYLTVKDSGTVEFLDATKLFINQDKEYVIVEGKKRNRIGKKVAVMG